STGSEARSRGGLGVGLSLCGKGNTPAIKGLGALGEAGVLCAPTAHQTNGPIGASPKTEWPRNLKSTIRRVRRGNYHLNYSPFQKSSTKNSSKSKNIAPLPDRRGPIQ